MLNSLKIFAIIYFVSNAFIYALQRRSGMPIIIPGDIYFRRGTRYVYIPLGLSLILTLIIFLILSLLKKKFNIQ